MKALVYYGINEKGVEERPHPQIIRPTDAVVKVVNTTICGTDLHILKGSVPTVSKGRILGHEGVGLVEKVGAQVANFQIGDLVLISCTTSCAQCDYCKKGNLGHCRDGGWTLGHTIDGCQAEYVRIPHADNSLYHLAPHLDKEALVMLSDILPTGFEVGVLEGRVSPECSLAIVGAGPVGLAALMTAQFYSPAQIITIDLDDNRLNMSRELGATHQINNRDNQAIQKVLDLTDGEGVDVVIEAIGSPSGWDICEKIVKAGGNIAILGVHGKSVTLHLEDMWRKNFSLTAGLVRTTTIPMLLKAVLAGRLNPQKLYNHHFELKDILGAYETFTHAIEHQSLKVMLHC